MQHDSPPRLSGFVVRTLVQSRIPFILNGTGGKEKQCRDCEHPNMKPLPLTDAYVHLGWILLTVPLVCSFFLFCSAGVGDRALHEVGKCSTTEDTASPDLDRSLLFCHT
jgi:hypothetical protein